MIVLVRLDQANTNFPFEYFCASLVFRHLFCKIQRIAQQRHNMYNEMHSNSDI